MTITETRSLADLLRRVRSSERHIVDVLIQERAPGLLGRPVLGALGRAVLYPLLGYRDAVRMADRVAALPGYEAMEFLREVLALEVRVEGLEQIPTEGAALIVGNHPTGIADGVVVFDALTRRRRDLTIFANRDAIRVGPGFEDLIIPVEWQAGRKTRERTRETLKSTQRAVRDGRIVVMFPSGRLAYMDEGRLRERPWMPTAVSLARRHGLPVIPMHISGRNSSLFYLFSRLSDQLRDITLFHEVVNKRGGDYRVRFGSPIAADLLEGDVDVVTAALQAHVESGLETSFPPR
ncbi:MAG: 1-acyl-sn-glycerol-3-phosphate acyltransferase [Pseudomonadales bacterium]|jgi:putative hemolysin|nr:1-acyl-sn-glycerol-3-phosphate acyltransferase [Pseudomonadales bacterium]